MSDQDRPLLRRLEPGDPLLQGPAIECEECGHCYDQRDGDGLCGYCAGEAFSPDDPGEELLVDES